MQAKVNDTVRIRNTVDGTELVGVVTNIWSENFVRVHCVVDNDGHYTHVDNVSVTGEAQPGVPWIIIGVVAATTLPPAEGGSTEGEGE